MLADNLIQRPPSPSKLSSQATDSPSKMSVPSRKQRNQPGNRVHDIEFAAEISNGLLTQIKRLQALLAEREEALKSANLEKSRLELETQGYSQRIKSLDESEQRYKDENWNLETQTHDLIASAKESAIREQRLQQSLATITSEKSGALRELDDLKQANGKLADDHASFRKAHDIELSSLRRILTQGENDRGTLQRKVEELTSQNQELARAIQSRLKNEQIEPVGDLPSEHEEFPVDRSESEHSPPPSPSKAAAKNSGLDIETLRTSLHHAQRMIQNLKSNIHREKTEKVELKRMLQETRDELEHRRGDLGSNGSKRLKRKSQPDLSKKSVRGSTLGASRSARTDVVIDDWENYDNESSPDRTSASRELGTGYRNAPDKHSNASDAYQTANETEDAFETANERDTATETEAFQTGAESMAGDSSDEMTETEGVNRTGTIRGRKPSAQVSAVPGNRASFVSTASTSADDDTSARTPAQGQPQKYRLRINRGSRRSRFGSEDPPGSNSSSMKNSPASFVSNNGQQGQSLFAELGEMDGDDSDGGVDGTPSKATISSQRSSPHTRSPTATRIPKTPEIPPVPRLPMVDSSMMTEPSSMVEAQANDFVVVSAGDNISPSTPQTQKSGVQMTPASEAQSASTVESGFRRFFGSIPAIGPALTSTPASQKSRGYEDSELSESASTQVLPVLGFSNISSQSVEPQSPERSQQSVVGTETRDFSYQPPLALSSIQAQDTSPVNISPEIPARNIRRTESSNSIARENAEDLQAPPTEPVSGGLFGSVLGWNRKKSLSTSQTTDRNNAYPKEATFGDPMKYNPTATPNDSSIDTDKALSNDVTDEGCQTILSAEQIDSLLSARANASRPPAAENGSDLGIAASNPLVSRSQESISSAGRARGKMADLGTVREAAGLVKTAKRPGSVSSLRAQSSAHPPLPPDHRQAIAAAAQKAPASEAPAVVMGPPVLPASAYRSSTNRPRTPSEQRMQSPTMARGSTTPRPRYSAARSMISRRSSVTSFASELDERFNIRADGMFPQGIDSGTDPRIIQAITQTMIGEYMWKYTRKAGRGEMSNNRHNRFFWVHPYTRTLYWGDRDPANPGRAESKAKSVAIEAVRVVTDDNPFPPGLHRKSLVIITPGRDVKITAPTSQRHETWFNALSYLLLRTGPEGTLADNGGNGLTAADVEEFNPSYGRRTSQRSISRNSLFSHNSRATANVSPQRNQSSLSTRRNPADLRSTSASRQSQRHSSNNQGSMSSRFSSYWRPGRNSSMRGSISSRQSATASQRDASSIYDASVVHDSAEDLRQVIERQEQDADRLENVRACCDGKSCVFIFITMSHRFLLY